MKTVIFFLMACICLTGCVDFKDTPGKSVWSEGMWIIPWLTGLGSLTFFIISFIASRSGWTKQDKEKGITSGNEKIPIYKVGKFWFGVILAVATVVIIIAQISAR